MLVLATQMISFLAQLVAFLRELVDLRLELLDLLVLLRLLTVGTAQGLHQASATAFHDGGQLEIREPIG